MDVIDQIEEHKAAENRCWLDLLRLALEVAPDRAGEILSQIEQHDHQIVRLLNQLGSD